jgi:DnaK suppressor protein
MRYSVGHALGFTIRMNGIHMPLTAEKVEEYRHLLNEHLQGLLGEAKVTVEGMHEAVRDTFADPTDRASLETSRNNDLRMRDRERKLISKVQDALQRLEEGTFGVCEECGEEIGDERMRARLVTTLCIECKEEQENREKRL